MHFNALERLGRILLKVCGQMQGGVLVLGSDKKLLYFHREQTAGDMAPIQDVMKACCS